jgi:acylphosphatase
MRSVRLIVRGKVQGVYYRASAKARADELGIVGWIRNSGEGHVEILATGNDYAINALVSWCRIGPAHAAVTGVDITETELRIFDEFTITR